MIEELSRMENKKFIFKCLDLLRDAKLLNNSNINLLTNLDLCKDNFLCKFAVLTEVPPYGDVPAEYPKIILVIGVTIQKNMLLTKKPT